MSYISLTIDKESLPYNHQNRYLISKFCLLESLSKRQKEMIKNNDKNKFLKTLKHTNLIFSSADLNLLENKMFLINNTLITIANLEKMLLSIWHNQIENQKNIQTIETLIEDITLIEFINADKCGEFYPLYQNNPSLIKIQCCLGNIFDTNSSDEFYFNKATNSLDKNIVDKPEYVTVLDGKYTTIETPSKKIPSATLNNQDINRLISISDTINKFYGALKKFSFIISNNKIYISNIETICLDFSLLDKNNYTIWSDSKLNIKTPTTPLTYSLQNLFYNAYIATISNLLYVDNIKINNLLFFENKIFEKQDNLKDILSVSPVFLFNPFKIANIFNISISNDIEYKNSTYFLEYLRFLYKILKQFLFLDTKKEKLSVKLAEFQNQRSCFGEMTLFEQISLLEEMTKYISSYIELDTYNNLLLSVAKSHYSKKEIPLYAPEIVLALNKIVVSLSPETKRMLAEKEDFEINKYLETLPSERADIEIFIKTYKEKYFTDCKIENKSPNIYKLIGSWENLQLEENNHKNIFLKLQANKEFFYTVKNTLYSLFKDLCLNIGLKLSLTGELESSNDIFYISVEELLFYKTQFPIKGQLLSICKTRKLSNTSYSHDIKLNSEIELYLEINKNENELLESPDNKEINLYNLLLTKGISTIQPQTNDYLSFINTFLLKQGGTL